MAFAPGLPAGQVAIGLLDRRETIGISFRKPSGKTCYSELKTAETKRTDGQPSDNPLIVHQRCRVDVVGISFRRWTGGEQARERGKDMATFANVRRTFNLGRI